MIELRVPGDKSITHRAIMLASIATGTSRIRDALVAGDTRSTAACMRALGVDVPDLRPGEELTITGVGLKGLVTPATDLDCGNSGTTTRLLMGLVAGSGVHATFTGDDSLRTRPMRRVTDPLAQMGARVTELGESGRLPIRVEGGSLEPLDYVSPHASAQIKSSLLLAGLMGGVNVNVTEPLLSRDHTERLLRSVGARVGQRIDPDGTHIASIHPVGQLLPLNLRVPGDFSSASFLLAAALLGAIGQVKVLGVGLNPTRTGFLDVVREMGAELILERQRDEAGEPIADITAAYDELRGIELPPEWLPRLIDEVPIIAMLAARAAGRTVIRGASELRVKESDRIHAIVRNLTALGVQAEELEDGLVIEGTSKPLRGQVYTALDHRIALCFGVLAAQRGNDIELDDPNVVKVSFPEFWSVLEDARAGAA